MSRQNIFDLLNSHWSLDEEVTRLLFLFKKESAIESSTFSTTILDIVNSYGFKQWKNKGRYINLSDFLSALNFDQLSKQAKSNVESFLTLIELLYNMFYICESYIAKRQYYRPRENYNLFRNNMDDCLAHYNQEAYIFPDEEKVLIAEKNPAATAVAELSSPETAYQVIQYNHHALKGDIATKKKILLHLAAELEPKRKALEDINKTLSTNIFKLLNNMNIRHNNIDSSSKDFHQFVADMIEEVLEEWYDEIYQMILLANLELDNVERKKKVEELKTHF